MLLHPVFVHSDNTDQYKLLNPLIMLITACPSTAKKRINLKSTRYFTATLPPMFPCQHFD